VVFLLFSKTFIIENFLGNEDENFLGNEDLKLCRFAEPVGKNPPLLRFSVDVVDMGYSLL
jgi:hypothetical protein